jgi:hypothetical protein
MCSVLGYGHFGRSGEGLFWAILGSFWSILGILACFEVISEGTLEGHFKTVSSGEDKRPFWARYCKSDKRMSKEWLKSGQNGHFGVIYERSILQ